MKGYLLIIRVFIAMGCDTNSNSSPCILQATRDAAPGVSSFAFNKDGTFDWINGWALSTSTYKGRYTIKDSIIIAALGK